MAERILEQILLTGTPEQIHAVIDEIGSREAMSIHFSLIRKRVGKTPFDQTAAHEIKDAVPNPDSPRHTHHGGS